MFGSLSKSTILLTVFAFLVLPVLPGQAEAEAQNDTRFRVLIPDMQPRDDDSSRRWGENVANIMRSQIDALGSYVVIDRDEVRELLRDFDVREEDLDCITARQLATQLNAQLVMCGTYQDQGDYYDFDAEFIAVESGDEMVIEPHQVERRRGDTDEAGDYIFSRFQEISEAQTYSAYCAQDYQSQNWEEALRTCNQAYELNPESVSVLFVRAQTYRQLERFEESLADYQAVLEQESTHESALENAGWVATQIGDTDLALQYYQQYLDLNPENTTIRLRVAYDLAQAGDNEGALILAEEGLEYDPDNVDIWEQMGGYAFRAAQDRRQQIEAADGEDATLPAGVREMYETAIEAFNHVLDARGEETSVNYLANTIRAYLQLDEVEQAIEQAQRSLAARPDNPQLNALLAQALYEAEQLEDAIEAMLAVMELDEDYSNLYTRLGQWNLEAGNVADAMTYFQESVERGERTNDQVARQIFAVAYNGYVQQDQYAEGIALFEEAKAFDPGPEVRGELDFWHGFALFRQAEQIQEPQTPESAEQALPVFQRARELFEAGADYAERMPQVNLNQFLGAADQYIEIQEAILRRGRR